jgi:hypothetical protein
MSLGREIFPPSGVKAFQLRLPCARRDRNSSRPSAWPATSSDVIRDTAGPDNVDIKLGYVGVQPSSYPINTIFLWTSGSHEGVLQVALKSDAPVKLEELQEKLRQAFHGKFPDAQFSFEPGDIVSRIMNFGAPTPVEVAVMGP